jgi:hypothetical protein
LKKKIPKRKAGAGKKNKGEKKEPERRKVQEKKQRKERREERGEREIIILLVKKWFGELQCSAKLLSTVAAQQNIGYFAEPDVGVFCKIFATGLNKVAF